MKLLMHTCCAPCSVYCIDSLRKEEIEPVVYWYNPNIHPYMEYKARRDCLKEYTKSINIKAIFEENYGLDEFCKNVINNLNSRCVDYCYPVRLEQTAKYAKENGYDTFTTTLLGGKIDVPTLNGNYTLTIPELTPSGTVMRLKNKGVKILNKDKYGDLLVTIKAECPKSLDKQTKDKLQEIANNFSENDYVKFGNYLKKMKK